MKELTFKQRDEFRRQPIAEKLISLLTSNIDISPMVIDGGWGTGKSEFCHKLIDLMNDDDTHHLIYVDAFQADHADEPLLTVFLIFNWFPARVFMGDAGSLFLGINFIIYTLILIDTSILNPWLILIIFSYFFVDTFGTLVTRLILKKKWNMRHTSHPYQNFSKVYSHSKMAKYLIIYHLIWLCPLLVLGNYYKEYVIIFSSLSLVPSLVFLIKFGPLRSSL